MLYNPQEHIAVENAICHLIGVICLPFPLLHCLAGYLSLPAAVVYTNGNIHHGLEPYTAT